MTLRARASVLLAVAFPVAGCSNESRPPPQAPPPQPYYGYGYGPPPQPPPAPPPAPVTAPQQWATPVDAKNDGGANIALQFFAVNNAGGMQSEGGLVLASFREGQAAEELITLVPGRCYTVLAAGVGDIQEIDLSVVVPPSTQPLAQAPRNGKYASIGEKGKCLPLGPLPVQGKVVVRAARGSGTIAARAFVK